jgi:hypothetical protein
MQDRVVQTALRMLLEPIFEREFAAQSYGFRPNLGSKDALRRVDGLLKASYVHVVDADLKSYFDTIPKDRLLALVANKASDRRVLALVGAFLEQQVLEGGQQWTPEQGTPPAFAGAGSRCGDQSAAEQYLSRSTRPSDGAERVRDGAWSLPLRRRGRTTSWYCAEPRKKLRMPWPWCGTGRRKPDWRRSALTASGASIRFAARSGQDTAGGRPDGWVRVPWVSLRGGPALATCEEPVQVQGHHPGEDEADDGA